MSCTHLVDAGEHPLLVRLSCLVLISLASCVQADQAEMFVPDPSLQDDFADQLPSSGSSLGFTYQIVQGHAILEGDILLGRVDQYGEISDGLRGRGVGKSGLFNRWADGIVVYESPVNNSLIQQENVEKAIAHWTENTTLSFVERTRENADQYPHYIQFRDTQSCASHVGMIGGPQPIYISDACSTGSVIHEIGHAVGLFHEHTRPDRDNFVQINWDEIVDGKDINFSLQTAGVANYSEYDYGSIMHYGNTFFSKSGNPTIILNDEIMIGQRNGLSPLDIESANKMYETDLALGTPSGNTTSNGFEIDITTYNMGLLGAHNLELLMRMRDDSQWVGVSEDSGWDCLTFDTEIKCTRDTMREQTESRFTVVSDSVSATVDDLSIRLISRTQDSDFSNNTLNDANITWHSLGVDLATTSASDPGAATSEIPVEGNDADSSPPPLMAANSAFRTVTDNNDAAAGASGGGLIFHTLALMATILGIRRRHRVAAR